MPEAGEHAYKRGAPAVLRALIWRTSGLSRWLTIIVGAIAVLGVYFGFRSLMTGGDSIATVRAETVPTLDKPVSGNTAARDGMPVVVRRSVAEVRPLYLSLSGRTEAARTVTVRAETTGTITSAPAREGALVAQGDLLCALDIEGKGARLKEAEADATAKELSYKAAVELTAKGWASEARQATAKATLDGAKAALEVARIELSKTQIRAPFTGVLEKRLADVGEFLAPGAGCGVVVELDPMLVVADAAEKSAGRVRLDAPARLRLSDGAEAHGKVSYVAKTADPTTRMFRVQVSMGNPGGAIPVGRIAEVRIQTGQGDAHKVAPELLTLDDQGRIGVRYLDVGGVVSFAPADVVDETAEGTWIAGLPREALIVAEGQDGVKPGLRATPVFRGGNGG
jgi:multidrug efflux system membrane fusion protein